MSSQSPLLTSPFSAGMYAFEQRSVVIIAKSLALCHNVQRLEILRLCDLVL